MTADDAGREAELRSYLLGALPAERVEEIDERVIADAEVHAELQATADDLIHAYLAGDLSAGDRERFESHFLASSRRRERVAFVRDLVAAVGRTQRAPSQPAAAANPRPSRLASLLPWAAALVVGLAVGSWGVGEKRLREAAQQQEAALKRELAEKDARFEELERLARAGSESGDVSTRPLLRVERGTGRGSSSIDIKGEWVRLRVLLETDLRLPSYRASVQNADGAEIYAVEHLPEMAGRTLDVMVPAARLPAGAYVLSIQRDTKGGREELDAVPFVVR